MEFALPAIKLLMYLGIALVVLGILLFAGIIQGRKGELNRKIGALISIALGIFLVLQKNSGKIIIEEAQIRLKSMVLRSMTIPFEDIRKAWIEDLTDSEWKPVRRKSGSAGSGVKSGRYRLRNGRSAFVVLKGNKALCIETRDGDIALIGVEDFDALISGIRSVSPRMAGYL